MVTSTKGSFHPVELVYRIGYGIIALGDLCERLWVHVAPGGDEAIPPALADRFNDLRFHLGQFERTSGGDARVANASRGLLDSLECTCGDFETAWSGPKNAWLAQALDLGEPEGAWDLK